MSFFEKLKDATIGFSGYARLGRDPRGSFGYMAILLAIVIAINGYINMVELRRSIEVWSGHVAAWPDFGVKGGEFYFEGPMPFQQTMEDGTLFVIDTTGQTQPEQLAGQPAILITRDVYYMLQPGVAAREFPFSRIRTDITKANLQEFLASGPERLLSFVYIFIYLFQLLFKAIDATVLALLALIYGAIVRRTVPFELGFKLGVYAMTLPVIIQWVFTDFHTYTAFGFTVWWSLAAIYLIFGLRAYLISVETEGPEGPVTPG